MALKIGALFVGAALVTGSPAASASVLIDQFSFSPGSVAIGDPHDPVHRALITLNLHLSLSPDPLDFIDTVVLNSTAQFLGGTVITVANEIPGGARVGPLTIFDIGAGGSQRSFSTDFVFFPGLYGLTASVSDISYINIYTVQDCLDFLCMTRDQPYQVETTVHLRNDLLAGGEVQVLASAPATPLPAALPLFATGLGVMGLLGWRRERRVMEERRVMGSE